MSDVSQRGSFEGRPSDILNLLGLDNPVTGCELGSILERPLRVRRLRLSYRYDSDERRFILISRFRYSRMRNSRMGLHFSDEDCDTSASSAAFFEVRNVL